MCNAAGNVTAKLHGSRQNAAALRLVYVSVRAILFTGLAVQRAYYLTHFLLLSLQGPQSGLTFLSYK